MTRMRDLGHADHDPLLIAAHAAGDAGGADLDRAVALVASCAECARLHRDLRAITGALASAPAPARSRDFRLTSADAAVLRRPTGWRRLLAPLSDARSSSGPLAASLAALGLAGLLLSAGPIPPLGAGSSSASQAAAPAPAMGNFSFDSNAPERAAGGLSASAAASMAAASAAASTTEPSASASTDTANATTSQAPSAQPAASDTSAGQGSTAGTAAPAQPAGSAKAALLPTPAASGAVAGPPSSGVQPLQGGGPSPLAIGSVVLLVAGVLLGVLRLAARRLA